MRQNHESKLLDIRHTNETVILHFGRSIDTHSVPDIRMSLSALEDAPYKNYIVDLSDVQFLDSTGIGLFAFMLKNAHRLDGNMVFAGAVGQPRAILGMVGFDDMITYAPNVSSAIKELERLNAA